MTTANGYIWLQFCETNIFPKACGFGWKNSQYLENGINFSLFQEQDQFALLSLTLQKCLTEHFKSVLLKAF